MTDDARKQLGERIRALLEEQHLTVRGFALMVGLSKDYIIDLEFGRKSPTLDTLIKVANGFGMSVSELLEGIAVPQRDDDADKHIGPRDSQNPVPPYYHTRL